MTTRGVLQNKKQSDQNDKSSTNTNEVSEEEQEDMEHAVDEVETHEEEGTNTDTDTDKQTEDTHTTSTASIWTDELKNMLVRACVKHGVGDWDAIKNDNAFDFGDMTSEDLHTEFKLLFPLEYKRLYPGAISAQNGNRLFNQWPLPPNGFRIKNRTRVPFTSEEDAAIYEGVTKFGAKWAHIASVYKLKRSGVAIRDRVRCRYPEIYALLGFEDKRTHVEKRRNHQKALQDAAPSPSLLETTHPVAVRREETNDTLNNNPLAESSIPSPELEDEANLLNTITPAMTSTSTTISTTNPMHSTPLNPFKRPVNTFDGLYGTPIDERSPQYKLAKTSFTSRITKNIQAANANTLDTTTASAQKPQAELVNMSYMSNAGMNESNNATNKRQSIIRDTFEEDPYETLPVDGQLAEEATFTLHSPVLPPTNRQPKGKQAFTSPSHKTPEKLRYLIGASSTTPRSAPSRELTRTPTPNRANIWRTSLDAQSLRNEEYQAETSRRLSYQNTLRDNIDDLVNSSTSRLSRVLDNAPPLPEPDSMYNDDYDHNITDANPYDREVLGLAAKQQRHEERRRHTLNENEIYGTRQQQHHHHHQQSSKRNRVFSDNTANATTPNPFNTRQNQQNWLLNSDPPNHHHHHHHHRSSSSSARRNISDQSLGTSMLRSRISHTADGSPQPAIIKDVVGARVRQGKVEYKVTFRPTWEPADAIITDDQGEVHVNRFVNTITSASRTPGRRQFQNESF